VGFVMRRRASRRCSYPIVPSNHADRGSFRDSEGDVFTPGSFVRSKVAQQAALQERALQRRELAACVTPIDLGDVSSARWRSSHASANESRRRSNSQYPQKHHDRQGAKEQQRSPVAEVIEEQDLLYDTAR